ncbi:MAG: homogentisate 1,2-dioxygenase [Oligoflexales bacterium]|nr:homogentisate 1,2-dioxygenase [Oligoflexales bacterium]
MAARTEYASGFASYFESEAIEGALPRGKNAPQKPPLGLYAEQLSGTAFTRPRSQNFRSWLYRIRPSVSQGKFSHLPMKLFSSPPFTNSEPSSPNQLRWDPLPIPQEQLDFIDGCVSWLGIGSPQSFAGGAIHLFVCTKPMKNRFFYNCDAEMLIVPQDGALSISTELGRLELEPGFIASIPRGLKIQVNPIGKHARGYLLENYGQAFQLPELGPIGANGLANPRDFEYPSAEYHDTNGDFQVICRYQGHMWLSYQEHHPLDVVAWHGNYAPYRYDLRLFNTIGSISFDHPDPSIFTVLTSQTDSPGVANIDFVIFPERWMVAEDTFRPPYYHRNIMSEYMGLIYGAYDAKPGGFVPGGGSLHNCMAPHGPDQEAFAHATEANLKPEHYKDTLAFMFESKLVWQPTKFALDTHLLQKNYQECWSGLPHNFKH